VTIEKLSNCMIIKSLDENHVKFAHVDLTSTDKKFSTPIDWALQALTPELSEGRVLPHVHLNRKVGSDNGSNPEAWVCLSGHCDFEVYDIFKKRVYSSRLEEKMLLIVERGGNSIKKSTANFKFLELKLGPFSGKNWEYF